LSVSLTTAEVASIRRIVLPARWGVRQKIEIGDIAWMVEDRKELEGACIPLRTVQDRVREFIFTPVRRPEIAISFGVPSATALKRDTLLRAKHATVIGDTLDISAAGHWQKHRDQRAYSIDAIQRQRDAVLESWNAGIIYRTDKNGRNGLRTPQLGALHAVSSHWTITQKPAIIVMPTGTGKTEVMLATTLASQCRTVLVVVPSDALRSQTAIKFQTLGVLRSIEVVPSEFMFPIVGTMRRVPKKAGDLELFDTCNVIVATMNALAGATNAMLDDIATRCTHLFIDEAHHAPADTWNNLRERFAARAVVQFTATPFRRDGRRMEGRIIYNYPLGKAQTEGYFRPIRFEQVWQWDEQAADVAIAAAAVKRLRQDLAGGLDHIVMARADSIERAKTLYETIYSAEADLAPVVIHNATRGRRGVLEAIKARRHRIIVCVDMLGEGFDLPQLKIAALHDAHRSLGVTLQFAGRFTRTSAGIGDATVIANLADPKVTESLEELYSEDADWNRLLPGLSYDAIRPQLRLSEFVNGLQSSIPEGDTEILTAATLQPKTSAVIYTAERWRPDAFTTVLGRDTEVVVSWKNSAEKVLVFIVRHPEELGWARTKDVTHLIYDLYVVFYDAGKKLLFIHSSVKSTHLSLAKAIGGTVKQVRGETIFRVLGEIERILFYNAGLLRTSSGAVRFQMFAGLDVAKAIDPVEQQGATKSNLFGAGYEGGRRVTIGCSQKGTVWSLQTSSIPQWMEWCQHVGGKLLNNSISTTAYLDHTLVPESITSLPARHPLCVEWPAFMFERITKGFDILAGGQRISWLDCDLEISAWGQDFEFVVRFPDSAHVTFRGVLTADRPLAVTELNATSTYAKSADLEQSLAEFFEEHPPLLRFEDGAELSGNVLIKPRTPVTPHFEAESLIAQDWTGVNIERESKWKNGVQRLDSVQHSVISRLLADPTFTAVIDDDDSGEAADVVAIRDLGDRIQVHLFHCKFSDAAKSGSRADDLYVVCGQAQKSVMWTLDFSRLVQHLVHRETKNLGGRPTRFERGTLKTIYRIQRAARKALPEYIMTVVQPGVSKSGFKPEHSAILGATSLFLRQRLSTTLTAWVSP
jgi:superfamily II DNA or RNA helicase